MKKTLADFTDIIVKLAYQGWTFEVNEQDPGEFYLQLHWTEACADTGRLQRQSSRKWKLSPWMTRSEVVQTAFKAVLTAVEHEARENFRYRDVAIFGPHFDVDDLVDRMPRKDVR